MLDIAKLDRNEKNFQLKKTTISQYSRATNNLLLKLLDSEALVYFGFGKEKERHSSRRH